LFTFVFTFQHKKLVVELGAKCKKRVGFWGQLCLLKSTQQTQGSARAVVCGCGVTYFCRRGKELLSTENAATAERLLMLMFSLQLLVVFAAFACQAKRATQQGLRPAPPPSSYIPFFFFSDSVAATF
jgi:hypothetical protein